MPPFSKANQLISDFEPKPGELPIATLPGQSSVMLNDSTHMRQFLEGEFCSRDLEMMAPRLWIMTTLSSSNINALHRQRVKGREIIITEDPRLHLVWIHNRIFIKPLPRYLLSHAFWKTHLDEGSERLGESRGSIYKAVLGFLRTYRYLIKHESDFNIAKQDHLRLIPHDVEWASFCQFVAGLDHIDDLAVSGRYRYGELRLTRLNFYAPLLLRKFHFEQVHGQYGDFFARLYGPVLFAFAVVSTILNSMQVALASEQLVSAHWESVWYLSRWFSMVSMVGAAIVSTWFILLWLWIFSDEWIFTVRHRMAKKRIARRTSTC
jgi:hypothetical protein